LRTTIFSFFFAFICAHSFALPNIVTFVSSLCFLHSFFHSANASCASRWQWSMCLCLCFFKLVLLASSCPWSWSNLCTPAVSLFLFLKVMLLSSLLGRLVCFYFNHNEYLQFDLNVGMFFVKIRVIFFLWNGCRNPF